MKEEEVIALSNLCNFKADNVSPLKQEASGRKYWRVSNTSDSFVLCYLDPSIGNHLDFIQITNSLQNNNINSVNVIYHNDEHGLTLQEDLGDKDLLSILNTENKTELIEKSLDLLIQIQNADIKNIDRFTDNELTDQMYLFKNIFLKNFLNIEMNSSIDDLISITMSNLKKHPWLNCHFDYERRNLILNEHQSITAIDYQDMKKGPIGIDMAGILIDHYYQCDDDSIRNSLKYFSNKINHKYSEEELHEFLTYGCLQRNMRILGTLTNLYLIHNRTYRLKDLPMIFSNLVAMIPDELNIKEDITDKVQSLLLKRISEI